MHKYKYKMELIKTSDSFKPGLKYTAFVSVWRSTHKTWANNIFVLFLQLKLAYQDDTPVQDSNGFITVSHGFSHNQEEYNKTQYPVPRNGILELNFYPPVDENVHTLGIEVSS